jgi:hypothetical protein
MAAQRALAEHLLKWASIWYSLVLEHAQTEFYRGMALLVRGVLTELADIDLKFRWILRGELTVAINLAALELRRFGCTPIGVSTRVINQPRRRLRRACR